MDNYDVLKNIADDHAFDLIAKADYIIAFCGTQMYTPKNRLRDYTNPPRRPDLVVAYYSLPEPHTAVLKLRK